jgi:hypothetical protein
MLCDERWKKRKEIIAFFKRKEIRSVKRSSKKKDTKEERKKGRNGF